MSGPWIDFMENKIPFCDTVKNGVQVHFMIQGFENSFGSLLRIA
jgi:hypothetical protein